jgi:hypothetical protein
VTPPAWLLIAGAVLVVLAVWATWTLNRLRRLAARVDQAWAALDTQLRRRVGLAEELARNHPDALGERLADRLSAAATGARRLAGGDRELAENELGHVLRELPAELPGVPAALHADIQGTAVRVGLARRFYNDAVRDTRALRRRRVSRLLRLHARRPLPRFFDIDARLPEPDRTADAARPGGGARP